MDFKGTGKRLEDLDLPRYGALIGVGEDEVHAFLDVETNGRGFDDQDRPKMLFEPHKFYAHTSGEQRELAVKYGVAYPKQGTKPYPRDSYPNLQVAAGINLEAALKSASWGLGQVLGENYVSAGYGDVVSFVEAMMRGEAEQLEAAVLFIQNEHLDDELRSHRWAAFARGYNGPNYRANRYDEKLAASYLRWSKVPDTRWPPLVAETPSVKVEVSQPSLPTVPQAVVMSVTPPAVDSPGKLDVTVTQRISWWTRLKSLLNIG